MAIQGINMHALPLFCAIALNRLYKRSKLGFRSNINSMLRHRSS